LKSAGTLRLFLALWPNDRTRAALARCRDAWTWDAGASPEPTERLHLTLHFLGAVAQQRVPELIEGLRVSSDRFTLCLDRAQRWPNGVAALTPKAAPPALLALHEALRDGLERLGLATETRRYRPHVTLARRVGHVAAPAQTLPVHWLVSGYALVESQPVTGGYVVLRHFG
jgi:RNA 2',3'-cyclic 3'-phosphodiesterase